MIIETSSEFDYHAIESYQGYLYAAGGDIWNKGNLAISVDGTNWQVDSFTNKSIFDLHNDGTDLFAVGNDGYIFRTAPNLKLNRTKHWGMIRGFSDSEEGYIAVGGKDFNKGWIYKVNSEISIDTIFNFEHELTEVRCGDEGMCIAIGYGIILISNDNGNSWKRDQESGDFYNSIAYNKNDLAFIVGYNGTILFSSTDNNHWKKLKNGHSPLSRNKPFRKIKFYDNDGFITGDDGLIWHSNDSGDTWSDISIKTNLDLFDFIKYEENLIAVSETGRILNIPFN